MVVGRLVSRPKSKPGLPWHSSPEILKGDQKKNEQILSLNDGQVSERLANGVSEMTDARRHSLESKDFSKKQDSVVREFFDSRRKMRTCTRIKG